MRGFRALRGAGLGACVGMLATTIALAAGAEVTLAADYQDGKGNVCEGTFASPGCSTWGAHVTGGENIAMGESMMNSLTGGVANIAFDGGALAAETTGSYNVAFGRLALNHNTTGNSNIAIGAFALVAELPNCSTLACLDLGIRVAQGPVEAPGEAHTLVAYESDEPMRVTFNVTGPLIWLDENGEPNGTFDVFDYIALCRNHYANNGIGADYIDKLFR